MRLKSLGHMHSRVLRCRESGNAERKNGVLNDDEWDYLKANGWTLLQADNCNDRYTSRGEYYTGSLGKR